ncbi:hypothetical protein GCM10027022_19400 [Alpinimonas psychrophila]
MFEFDWLERPSPVRDAGGNNDRWVGGGCYALHAVADCQPSPVLSGQASLGKLITPSSVGEHN